MLVYAFFVLLYCFHAVDGRWGPFGSWSSCSKTCGGGIRTRQRECNNPPPSNGGVDCVGRTTRKRGCKKNACPGKKPMKCILSKCRKVVFYLFSEW